MSFQNPSIIPLTNGFEMNIHLFNLFIYYFIYNVLLILGLLNEGQKYKTRIKHRSWEEITELKM